MAHLTPWNAIPRVDAVSIVASPSESASRSRPSARFSAAREARNIERS